MGIVLHSEQKLLDLQDALRDGSYAGPVPERIPGEEIYPFFSFIFNPEEILKDPDFKNSTKVFVPWAA